MSKEIEKMIEGLVRMKVPASEIEQAKQIAILQDDTLPLERVVRKYWRNDIFHYTPWGKH